MEQTPLIPEVFEGHEPEDVDAMGRPLQIPNDGGGRPRGAKNHSRKFYEDVLTANQRMTLVQRLYERAIAGSPYDTRTLLDRLWPKPRTAAIALEMPATETPADLRRAMHDLLNRVTSGEITTDDGQALISMLKDMLAAHSIETLLPGGSGAPAQYDARDLLRERIVKVIEERKRRELSAPVPPVPAEHAA